MAWVAGADVSTGDLITAATWNNYMGATGSLEFLSDYTHADVTGIRAVNTIYQNTGDKAMFVLVNLECVNSETAKFEIGSASPPNIQLGEIGNDPVDNDSDHHAITFIVPKAWYYRMVNVDGSPIISDWHEWS